MEKLFATVVTGGTRGIGRATVLRFAKEGPVLFTARDKDQAEKLCEEVRNAGGSAEYCLGDVSDQSLAKAAAEKVAEKGWTVRNLVLNAGISGVGATATFPLKDWKAMFATNVDGAFHFTQSFLPGMLQEKAGTICILAGKAGVKGYRSMSAYSASKFALVGFAEALAEEVGSKGLKVFPLCPGPVDTDMTGAVVDGLVKKGVAKAEAVAKIAAGSGQERLLTAAEVAEKIAWVCSKDCTADNGKPLLIADK